VIALKAFSRREALPTDAFALKAPEWFLSLPLTFLTPPERGHFGFANTANVLSFDVIAGKR